MTTRRILKNAGNVGSASVNVLSPVEKASRGHGHSIPPIETARAFKSLSLPGAQWLATIARPSSTSRDKVAYEVVKVREITPTNIVVFDESKKNQTIPADLIKKLSIVVVRKTGQLPLSLRRLVSVKGNPAGLRLLDIILNRKSQIIRKVREQVEKHFPGKRTLVPAAFAAPPVARAPVRIVPEVAQDVSPVAPVPSLTPEALAKRYSHTHLLKALVVSTSVLNTTAREAKKQTLAISQRLVEALRPKVREQVVEVPKTPKAVEPQKTRVMPPEKEKAPMAHDRKPVPLAPSVTTASKKADVRQAQKQAVFDANVITGLRFENERLKRSQAELLSVKSIVEEREKVLAARKKASDEYAKARKEEEDYPRKQLELRWQQQKELEMRVLLPLARDEDPPSLDGDDPPQQVLSRRVKKNNGVFY